MTQSQKGHVEWKGELEKNVGSMVPFIRSQACMKQNNVLFGDTSMCGKSTAKYNFPVKHTRVTWEGRTEMRWGRGTQEEHWTHGRCAHGRCAHGRCAHILRCILNCYSLYFTHTLQISFIFTEHFIKVNF